MASVKCGHICSISVVMGVTTSVYTCASLVFL